MLHLGQNKACSLLLVRGNLDLSREQPGRSSPSQAKRRSCPNDLGGRLTLHIACKNKARVARPEQKRWAWEEWQLYAPEVPASRFFNRTDDLSRTIWLWR